MKKLALFLEGQTELIFARRLLEELGNRNDIVFARAKLGGGTIETLTQTGIGDTAKHFVLLYDCGNDTKVKSAILENLPSLVRAGYGVVLGLHDLYTKSRDTIASLEAIDHNYGISVEIVVAVMEIEAWFLGEYHHFPVWHPKLTSDFINERLGVRIEDLDFEAEERPKQLLDRIYKLVGAKGYTKKAAQITKVVYCLDFAHFCFGMIERSRSVERLATNLDLFLQA
jgi:hypothetical protein